MLTRKKIQNNPIIIDSLRDEFVNSELYQNMLISDEYYYMNNTDVMSRRQLVTINGDKKVIEDDGSYRIVKFSETKEDTTKANNKIPHGFHYELVSQCKNFLAGNPVKVTYKHLDDFDSFDDDDNLNELKRSVDYILNDVNSWGTFIQVMIKNAQKHSKSFARVNVDSKGQFRFTPLTAKEVIPLYDDYGDIYLALRMFTRAEYNDKGEKVNVEYVEVLDDSFKDVYQKEKEWKLIEHEVPLFSKVTDYGLNDTKLTENLSWGKVPIIEWKFTDDEINSLQPIKPFIDLVDGNLSDFANDLDDINELIWILRNYNGQDLAEFMRDAKENKAIQVGEDGDVRTERNELPYKARVELYDISIRNIYRFGRGIDFTDRSNLGNITGTGLKWSYELLEEKANELEQYGQRALDDLFSFLFIYLKEQGDLKEDLNATHVEFLFDRSLMIDESEVIDNGMKFAAYGSLETALEHIPWVDDVDEELKRINSDGGATDMRGEYYDRQIERDIDSEDGEDADKSAEEDSEADEETLQRKI